MQGDDQSVTTRMVVETILLGGELLPSAVRKRLDM